MTYGICTLSIVPCRKEPSGTSEMVTQLLFGEHYSVLEHSNDWLRIKIAYDQYECWISVKQHTQIAEPLFRELGKNTPALSRELVQVVHDKKNDVRFPVTIGASLPFFKDHGSVFGTFDFSTDGQAAPADQKKPAPDILATAYLYLNAPYLWGGKTLFGIDCSGFTQMVFKLNGYTLPRDAWQQVDLGTPLSFVEEAEPCDLAFFDNEEGRIVHVGILIDSNTIIHASGKVRIDKFDHYGIFGSDTKKYSHTLRVIKRVIS